MSIGFLFGLWDDHDDPGAFRLAFAIKLHGFEVVYSKHQEEPEGFCLVVIYPGGGPVIFPWSKSEIHGLNPCSKWDSQVFRCPEKNHTP